MAEDYIFDGLGSHINIFVDFYLNFEVKSLFFNELFFLPRQFKMQHNLLKIIFLFLFSLLFFLLNTDFNFIIQKGSCYSQTKILYNFSDISFIYTLLSHL